MENGTTYKINLANCSLIGTHGCFENMKTLMPMYCVSLELHSLESLDVQMLSDFILLMNFYASSYYIRIT